MSKRGDNPYELNAPSEMPEGFGGNEVNLTAQSFFMKYCGIPETFAGQLMYVGPIVNEFNEDFNWYSKTMSLLNPQSDITHALNVSDVYELRAPHQAKSFHFF